MLTRAIPASGESLAVIGLGTYRGFDQGPRDAGYEMLGSVVDSLLEAGGSMLDSSPMYGRAETSVGEVIVGSSRRSRCFVATKVWTSGRAAGERQMLQSFQRLQCAQIDLVQVHNLVGYDGHIKTLRDWQADGKVRYLGISHYTSSAYPEVEAILKRDRLDFLQINYSVAERSAEQRLLPLAQDKGVAVIVNVPFGGGGLLRRLRERALPDWATSLGCQNWGQVLLKFVLSHPAVTCAIPGTASPAHMAGNAQAGTGEIPPAAFWKDKVNLLVD